MSEPNVQELLAEIAEGTGSLHELSREIADTVDKIAEAPAPSPLGEAASSVARSFVVIAEAMRSDREWKQRWWTLYRWIDFQAANVEDPEAAETYSAVLSTMGMYMQRPESDGY